MDELLTITVTRESYKEKLRQLIYDNRHKAVLDDPYFQAAMGKIPFSSSSELQSLLLDETTAMTATLAMLQVVEFVRF